MKMGRTRSSHHRFFKSSKFLVVLVISCFLLNLSGLSSGSGGGGGGGLGGLDQDGGEDEDNVNVQNVKGRQRGDQQQEEEEGGGDRDDGGIIIDRDPSPSPYPPRMTEEERLKAFERMWSDPDDNEVVHPQDKEGKSKEELSDTEKIVEAIKMRFTNPDVLQIVEPPNLGGQNPLGVGDGGSSPPPSARRFKLVLKEPSVTPAEPITSLLNKRKQLEIPKDVDEPEIITADDEASSQWSKANQMFKEGLQFLGPSASRDATGFHILTSVGKTEKVEQAYILLQQAALRGHKMAMEMVAWGQLLGPLPLDIESARIKFEKLGKMGYPNSQTGMGFLHANGLDAKLSGALPTLYYTFSSIAGNSWAQMALGYRYWAGIGVQVSCEKALEQYRRVAATVASEVSEVGTGPAIQRIRLLDEMESNSGAAGSSSSSIGSILNSDILDYYTMLAERGDLQAQVGLGQLHFQGGRGVSPDHHLALRYFKRAAEAGSPIAMAFLGKMYLEGNDAVESDTSQALRWFQRAAQEGSPVGQSGLGLMYLTGKGLPKDPSKALQYFTMAAEQGWVDGQLHLGNMYMTGIGVRRDYQQAAKYYNLAAQSGHILAIYNLAQMHATGTGMMRSCTAAVELYKTVAERGRWGLLLAEAHQDYREKRYSQALLKYLLLSELGYEAAQANAGFMLERGEVGYEVFESWKNMSNKVNATTTAEASKEGEEKKGTVPTSTSEKSGDEGDQDTSKDQAQVQGEPEKTEEDPQNHKTRSHYELTSPQSLLSRALQQWSRSASQGYSQARVRLGDYYYYGWGTHTDYSNAATQYRLASEQQRNPQAMFNLAYMHEQGLGLKQDLHLAKRFYDMAAETSVDATVPVALALIKLSFISTLQNFKLYDFFSDTLPPQAYTPPSPHSHQHQHNQHQHQPPPSSNPEYDDGFSNTEESFIESLDLANNWDLYLMTVIIGILGILAWIRRNFQEG